VVGVFAFVGVGFMVWCGGEDEEGCVRNERFLPDRHQSAEKRVLVAFGFGRRGH